MLTALSTLPLEHLPGSLLYLSQAAAYGMAYWAERSGNPAPSTVYLASCLIHVTLGVLFCTPLG